jgi:hypothetical protein
MFWKHEKPLEEETSDSPTPVSADLRGDAQLQVEAPPRCIFGSPSLVEPNHPQEPGIMNAPQQRPSMDIAEHTLSASNSYNTSTDQASRRSKRKPATSESLGPAHPSKIPKTAMKTRLGPQPSVSKKVSFSAISQSSDADIAEPEPSLVPVNLHKRPQVQIPITSVAKDSKRTTRSQSKQNIADNTTARSSAKPQGISKRPRAKAIPGQVEARKE